MNTCKQIVEEPKIVQKPHLIFEIDSSKFTADVEIINLIV